MCRLCLNFPSDSPSHSEEAANELSPLYPSILVIFYSFLVPLIQSPWCSYSISHTLWYFALAVPFFLKCLNVSTPQYLLSCYLLNVVHADNQILITVLLLIFMSDLPFIALFFFCKIITTFEHTILFIIYLLCLLLIRFFLLEHKPLEGSVFLFVCFFPGVWKSFISLWASLRA